MKRPRVTARLLRPTRRAHGARDGDRVAWHVDVFLRWASEHDDATLEDLAALDGVAVPTGRVLIGEVGGRPWAAISLSSGQIAADPFRPTASVGELLRVRATQITAAAATRPSA